MTSYPARESPARGARSSARAPALPAAWSGRHRGGEGVRYVAGAGWPFRSADRPSPLPASPCRPPLFSLCPAARRGRGGERGRLCAGLDPGLAAAPPSPHPIRSARRRRRLEPERPTAAGAGRGRWGWAEAKRRRQRRAAAPSPGGSWGAPAGRPPRRRRGGGG